MAMDFLAPFGLLLFSFSMLYVNIFLSLTFFCAFAVLAYVSQSKCWSSNNVAGFMQMISQFLFSSFFFPRF